MKDIRKAKKNLKLFCTGTFLASIIFSGAVFATDTEFQLNTTNSFDSWNNLSYEEKEHTVMPRSFDVKIPDVILKEYIDNKNEFPKLLTQLLKSNSGNLGNFENVSSAVDNARYTLSDDLALRVEHQGRTTECWAFSLLKSVETNKALSEGVTEIADFSERHMDYATSRTFLDGTNEVGFDREVGNGGLLVVGLAYLTNGQGAVLEDDMRFENNEDRINLNEIDKDVNTIVNEYFTLPTIHKEYRKDSNGNTLSVTYKKADGNEYTQEELEAVRKMYKTQIVNNGSIASMTGGNLSKYYNKSSAFSSTAYNCNDSKKVRDHAISIVGWDDNYSKYNFAEGARPSSDGAYIVLNSYGDTSFENGYLYISYEDFFIEEELYGIGQTSPVNYDNLYQYDYYGGIYEIGLDSGNVGYIGATYNKETEGPETIKSVGVTICDYSSLEIYVKEDDTSLELSGLKKVATTDVLAPGYHRINIVPTQITGENFGIVVKQTSLSNRFYFEVETRIEATAYGLVDSEHRSFMSLDGYTWSNLSSLSADGIDMRRSDVCIKVFTDNEEAQIVESTLETDEYIIMNNDVMKINYNTTKAELLSKLTSNGIMKIYSEDGNEVDDNEKIKTGMKLVLEDQTEYCLIVRGDLNKDGNITLSDLSKIVLHYNETRGYILDGSALKAADMNCDGGISLVDVSQMVVLYNSI